jgi:hypothetical protein
MDIEKIRGLRLSDPFKPFAIRTKSGEQLPVEYPRWLSAYSPRTGGVTFIAIEDVTDVGVDEKLSTPWRRSR